VLEAHDRSQHRLFRLSEFGDIDAGLRPAQSGGEGDQQDLRQIMARIGRPGIRQSSKEAPKRLHRGSPDSTNQKTF
jgi:hypothetical protein